MSSAEKIFRIAGVLCFFISWAGGKTCPNLGVIWNDDGDYAITSEDPRQAAEMVRYLIDSCVGTGIKTITYSIGAGSEILLYPTRIGNNWGWRTTRYGSKLRAKPLCVTTSTTGSGACLNRMFRNLVARFTCTWRNIQHYFGSGVCVPAPEQLFTADHTSSA